MAERTNRRFGRILVFVYGLFALAATARSLVQLATQYHLAPAAYWVSLFSGIVYCVATWALATNRRRVAIAAVAVELAGVLVIGTLSQPDDVDRSTVWSTYGNGYGYVPLVLPFVGLWWLWRTGRLSSSTP
ncbi:hypothetical protein D9V37_07745 [Nocardioides mangrovicus]|uniref:Integral membrane protein n=1 Tax=Nocardioides mangrovicus TaxID=2478913 RepID=A0A3L8P3U8_9ACTN|nr:hypothetical protein [Nocardioides mangrovicus]RLV49781.1 hypothetical protein D9V37_07745 [Nocardioides mangrovicus]